MFNQISYQKILVVYSDSLVDIASRLPNGWPEFNSSSAPREFFQVGIKLNLTHTIQTEHNQIIVVNKYFLS